jgi:hypothetical protein
MDVLSFVQDYIYLIVHLEQYSLTEELAQTACLHANPSVVRTGHYLWRGWHRREMFSVAKILLTQPLKSKKN